MFLYDPFGRRIQKSGPLGATTYVYDGANIVAEYDGTGALAAKYAQGAGVDQPLAMWRGGQVGYYQADGLGSITSLTDSNGSALVTYTYDAFGRATATGALFNPFQYTGREWDQEAGLYYYRARYYDAGIGRFTSTDPAQFGGGVNFYAYVSNNPTVLIDPFGLCWIYHQSTGQLSHEDEQTGNIEQIYSNGYAGHGLGLNDPESQSVGLDDDPKNPGPLPQGQYTIGVQRDNKTSKAKVLRGSMRLTPDMRNEMFGRAGFLIHGDNNNKNQSASEGCIILPPQIRNKIGKSSDKCLKVVR
jgi:RHS repeat-associated protein